VCVCVCVYKPWMVLGLFEGQLDDLIDENMSEAAHFDAS